MGAATVTLEWTGAEDAVCHDLVEADLSAAVKHGDKVTVPAELAERLVAGSAGWSPVKAPAKKPAAKQPAAKKPAPPADPPGSDS